MTSIAKQQTEIQVRAVKELDSLSSEAMKKVGPLLIQQMHPIDCRCGCIPANLLSLFQMAELRKEFLAKQKKEREEEERRRKEQGISEEDDESDDEDDDYADDYVMPKTKISAESAVNAPTDSSPVATSATADAIAVVPTVKPRKKMTLKALQKEMKMKQTKQRKEKQEEKKRGIFLPIPMEVSCTPVDVEAALRLQALKLS